MAVPGSPVWLRRLSVGGESFEARHYCDPVRRVSEARVLIADIVERHRRVAPERGDVLRAAAAAGLDVAGYASARSYCPFLYSREFYVLRKRGAGPHEGRGCRAPDCVPGKE